MIQWRCVAKQDLTVYTSVGPLMRVLIVFKSCDLGAHCLEQSESEDAVQSLVERKRKERRGKGERKKGEGKREMEEMKREGRKQREGGEEEKVERNEMKEGKWKKGMK